MRKNIAKWLPHRICKESVAITDLAIGDLGFRLGVRVATVVVGMMKRKKFATSEFFQFRLCHSNAARNAPSNGLRLILSFYGKKEFCRSFDLVEDV